ncbi:MAG: M50 family metallopeptidase [Kiritimatiellae bacterium]|nr:M50 family metallopeptidase [Kiritimatiellia bacterium]
MLFGKGQFEVARVWGVPICLDISLILMAVIFVFRNGSIIIGLLSAAILLASILLHELGHTAVALSYGCRVRDITLMLLGGRATLVDMPRGPWREAWMAAAGPLVSLLLGLCGFFLSALFPVGSLLGAVCWYLQYVNFSLLIFNLIPAFPMDGGRIFRALLESRLGRRRATFIAFRLAQVLALCMAIWAVVDGFDIILLLIAYFVFSSSKAEYEMVKAESGYGFGGYGGPGDDSVVISPPPYGTRDEVTDIFKER